MSDSVSGSQSGSYDGTVTGQVDMPAPTFSITVNPFVIKTPSGDLSVPEISMLIASNTPSVTLTISGTLAGKGSSDLQFTVTHEPGHA